MTFKSLKTSIFNALLQTEFTNTLGDAETNKIIAGCLIYNTIQNIIKADSSYEGRVNDIALSYAKTYKTVVEDLKNKYISYSIMKKKTDDYKLSSFIEISSTQIKEIYDLYLDKTLIEKFSIYSYSQKMYNINNANKEQDERLREIHFKIMVPIIKYYIDNYGLSTRDLNILSCNYIENNPGKVIIFKINGINNSKLIYDLKSSIGISKYIYDIELYYNYIKITIN